MKRAYYTGLMPETELASEDFWKECGDCIIHRQGDGNWEPYIAVTVNELYRMFQERQARENGTFMEYGE